MHRYVIALVAGGLIGGLSVWGLTSGDDVADASVGPTSRRDVRRTPEGRLIRESTTELADCKQTLVRTQVALRGVQATAARAVAGQLFDDDETSGLAEASPGSPDTNDPAEAAAARSERERRREATEKVRHALVEHFQITEEEEGAIADFVCPQRENVRGLFADFSEGRIDADTLFREISSERTASVQGLTRAFGEKRYRTLRRLGATGILAGRLCKQP